MPLPEVLAPAPGLEGLEAPRGSTPIPLGDSPEADAMLGMGAEEAEDGSVLLTPPAGPPAVDPRTVPWGDNLAEHLPQATLSILANEVLEGLRADISSNAGHYAQLEEGMAALGLKKERLNVPFKNAPGAQSSLTLRAAMRFNASAMGELMPAAGPVRTQIEGEADGIEGASQRKQKFMNHHLTAVDEGYYPDRDQGLFLLGIMGSIFRMVYRDPDNGLPTSRFRTPFNLVVSYHTSDLHYGGRFTEIDQLPPSEVRRRQVLGHWRDVVLGVPTEEESEVPGIAVRMREGRVSSDRQEDTEHSIYTQRLIFDVPGLEHLGEDREPTGLPLPWRITIDKDSREVLRLERDWDPADPRLRPKQHFSHERYMPGLGFYGLGFAHLLASPQDASTTMLRQGLAANTLVSFPGGLRIKGAKVEASDMAIGPCEFREIDTGGMPIGNAVMALPYRDVPPSFVPLLQQILADGEQIGQIAEQQIGEGRQDAPVGTTLALIEQAVKVESAVIKRLHAAQRKELRLLAALFAEDKSAVYPYHVAGKMGVQIAPDFATHDDILPVSDPNTPTQTQRLGLAQAKLSLAQSAPHLYDLKAAHQGVLRVIGTDDAEIARLMPPPNQGVPSDPITEFAMALKSAPLAVHPMQMHEAHITAHLAQMQLPELPPEIMTGLLSHVGDHLAALYRGKASVALGIQLPPLGTPLPPQIEQQLSVRFADVAGQITTEIAPYLLAATGDPGKAAEMHLKAQELASKAEDRAAKEREGQRKAEQAARQDAGEALRETAQLHDRAAERQLSVAEMEHERALAMIEASQTRIEAEASFRDNATDVRVAEIGRETARIDGKAQVDAAKAKPAPRPAASKPKAGL